MQCQVLFCPRAWKSGYGITKTLLVMKLTSILLLCACLQVSAHVHAQTVSFSGTNVPLEKVFAAVEKQTGYVFFFDEAILKDARPVTIRAENDPLELFLSRVLFSQPFKFSLLNKTIVISRKEVVAPSVADTTHPSDQQLLQGMVLDENGTPLVGASVTIKGTGKSTITNGRGAFSMPAPAAKSKVIISYVGYKTREVTLAEGQQQLVARLSIAVNTLDEEVVQAYGKTSQRLAVGSIVKVSGEEIQKQPVMNPLIALNGKVPGLLITPTSGYVSAPVKVEIRGRNTINPMLVADPMYVIDGVPLTILDVNAISQKPRYETGSPGFWQGGLANNTEGQSPLFSINPADIESISVLKDAAATAIYGSRGANGVILITTKRAQPGKTKLSMQVQQSISTAPRYWDMLKTPEYLQMRREALKYDALPLNMANFPEQFWDTTRYTDWQKEIWGVAKSTDANINLSGGDHRTSFTLGAGYNSTEEITTISGTNQRITISSGLTHRSSDQRLTIDLRAGYSHTYVKAIKMPAVTTLAPNAPPIFDATGKLNYAEWNAVGLTGIGGVPGSPFQSVLTPSTNYNNLINASLRVNYNLARGLSLGILGGYNNSNGRAALYTPIAAQNPLIKPTGSATFGYTMINNWNIEPQLNYNCYIGSGKLETMVGGTYQSSFTRGTSIAGSGYTNDALIQSISSALFMTSSENYAQKKYVNIHGRINYNLQNKYILELAGNRDGSSNFGPGRQFGNFWSAGAAWIASEEEWAKRVLPKWWSFLKFNASYGITGLDEGGFYQYLSLWRVPSASQGSPAYNGVVPIAATNHVNQDYQWQENRKINADLSMGFLDDRITLMLTWYNNRCNNQLTNIPTPLFTGFTTVTGNSPAHVENSGWEGMINAKVISSKNFTWTLGGNIAINRNKLLSYPDFEYSNFYRTIKIGQPLNAKYLLHYIGINPLTGKRSYVDYNHDGLITNSSSTIAGTGIDDRYIVLDPTPRYSGGINSQFTYKRFMLGLFFIFKKQIGALPYAFVPGNIGNIPLEVFNDHWQQPGDQTRYTRFATSGTGTSDAFFAQSDGAYTDASFLRLNNLAFSYSLPEKICKKLRMQGAAFSVNMQNVFVITPYTGIDPETSFGNMPQARVIAGRVSFTF
jgi:TonB-linked SusC/RagA family outer membrane protein